MFLFESKPIKMEAPSNGDGVMGLYTLWPMGSKISGGQNSSLKMNLECGPKTGHRECG